VTSSAPDGAAPERLQRRYERERRARLEAEAIAEQGLREIYAANRSLDRRIAERTRELEEATRRAQAASEAKSEFLAHIGHELRTPISGIAGMLELLDGVAMPPQARRWLASASESSARLQRLVDRILWFIELEATDLRAEATPRAVDVVLDGTAERWRRRCAGAGQLLSVELATPVGSTVAATDELERGLDELLDNAVRHAAAGAVRLRATALGDAVRFEVEDSGPGMEASVAATASDMLDPGGDPTTRRSAGAGIGLALVRRVTAALGGGFGIDRADTGGSIVWMTAPAGGQGSRTASR
jgi:signal transduction histidine kinase